MENVVTAVFDIESEAYQAFTEIRQVPFGKGYEVAEAALLKCEGDTIVLADAFDAAAITSDDTATGMLVGSLVGILGGPLGVLIGAGTGALVGSSYDRADTIDSLSLLEVTAAKLYDGEVAIVALVQEDEPAFDIVFEKYQTTIIRQFAVDVMDEVELARKITIDLATQAKERLRAERKAKKAAEREEFKSKLRAHFDELKTKHDERKAIAAEAQDIANAQFTTSTKEMLGTE